jgi:two-component system, OmpR family, sensor histidine kinase BaeS
VALVIASGANDVERMMNQRFFSRLSARLGLAMLASVLITIVLILTTVAVFGYARLPKISPVREFRDLGLEAELSKPNTELSFVIKSDGATRSIPASDDFKKSLTFFLQQGDVLPSWLLNGLLIGAFASIILALVTAYHAAKRIAQPIEAVSRAATQMGQGDLSARAPIVLTLHHNSFETLTLAQNFNTMAEALERAQQQRRDMTADIAHELRTPLGVMKSRLEALEDGVIPFDVPEVQKLQQHTRLLIRLVEDLRLLSLADSGQLEIHPRVFDLATNARIAVGGFEARANAANVRLHLHAPEKLPFSGDPDRIMQVISNLISNALQHTPAGGEITVKLEQSDQIKLEVRDSGSGIPENQLERIFDRFHRVDASRSRASGGTGLGLAIVRTIVELHGGTISASNRNQNGAVFTVILPNKIAQQDCPVKTLF